MCLLNKKGFIKMPKNKTKEIEPYFIWRFNEKDIKPCPCCANEKVKIEESFSEDKGGPNSYSMFRDRPVLRFYFIHCPECGMRTDVYSTEVGITKLGEPFIRTNGIKKALDAWNNRKYEEYPSKKAKWYAEDEYGLTVYECSNCGNRIGTMPSKFCLECGASMTIQYK